MTEHFTYTPVQREIIKLVGSGFVTACPGAGKTQTIIARIQHLMVLNDKYRGVALLSFSNATITELGTRITKDGLLPTPVFPHFLGTFDSFIWQFFILPFGIEESKECPTPIPDKDEMDVIPYFGATPIKLKFFNAISGKFDLNLYKLKNKFFTPSNTHTYEKSAKSLRERLLKQGIIDYKEARAKALKIIQDITKSEKLLTALSARFGEIVVDETQDCNSEDLKIIKCLLKMKIPIKLVCDPNQAIYEFRGSDSSELVNFSVENFDENQRFCMNENFRSSSNIVKGSSIFKQFNRSNNVETASGKNKRNDTPIYILSYPGSTISNNIGNEFDKLVSSYQYKSEDCPILAAKWNDSYKAVGKFSVVKSDRLSVKLAKNINSFFQFDQIERRVKNLEKIHEIVLQIENVLRTKENIISYQEYILMNNLDISQWRPKILKITKDLQFSKEKYKDSKEWLEYARTVLNPLVPPNSDRTINQLLSYDEKLDSVFTEKVFLNHPTRSIHSVKGMEFPAVCLVIGMSCSKLFDQIENENQSSNEDLQKYYVAVTRAEKLLVIAVPKSKSHRLTKLLIDSGANVKVIEM